MVSWSSTQMMTSPPLRLMAISASCSNSAPSSMSLSTWRRCLVLFQIHSRRLAGLVQCLRERIALVVDADESDSLRSHLSSVESCGRIPCDIFLFFFGILSYRILKSVILIAIIVDFVVRTLLFILQYKSRRKPACASFPSTVPPKNHVRL